jgi:hypothetical protein
MNTGTWAGGMVLMNFSFRRDEEVVKVLYRRPWTSGVEDSCPWGVDRKRHFYCKRFGCEPT